MASLLFGLLLPLGPLHTLNAHAETPTVNQAQAQGVAENVNRQASDESLQNSSVHAMKALMNLADMNFPGALTSGVAAYGKYRNSENLDKLGNHNAALAATMSSVGAKAAAPPPKSKAGTTFRRLDPSFLRQGAAAQVAAEFEKRTGMRREEFLQRLSVISENKIRRSDPQLVDKALSRFEEFTSHIPNREFRGKLQKGIRMVPSTIRTGLVAKAVAKFAGFKIFGTESGISENLLAALPSAFSASEGDATAPSAAEAASEISEVNRAPASEIASAEEAIPHRKSRTAEALEDVVQAAVEAEAPDNTIFEIVSRRYRALTPKLARLN